MDGRVMERDFDRLFNPRSVAVIGERVGRTTR